MAGNAEYRATYTEKAKPGVYEVTSGADGTWTEGSSDPLVFVFERTIDDETSVEHFAGIEVDAEAVPKKDTSGKANYTVKKGSAIVSLKPTFLATLAHGDHTLRASFDDGNDVEVLSKRSRRRAHRQSQRTMTRRAARMATATKARTPAVTRTPAARTAAGRTATAPAGRMAVQALRAHRAPQAHRAHRTPRKRLHWPKPVTSPMMRSRGWSSRLQVRSFSPSSSEANTSITPDIDNDDAETTIRRTSHAKTTAVQTCRASWLATAWTRCDAIFFVGTE